MSVPKSQTAAAAKKKVNNNKVVIALILGFLASVVIAFCNVGALVCFRRLVR